MEVPKNIKVMIVDDHAITRAGLKTLLSVYDDLVFVGEACNGLEALDSFGKFFPDVILMDLDMPVMDGISAIKNIKSKNPRIKFIALTSFSDKKLVRDAIKAGASGYVIKNIGPTELAETIRDCFLGKIKLAPEAMEAVIDEIQEPHYEKMQLTEQELKILKLLAKGLSNIKIAKELFISHHTVKFHISNLLSKLGASTRAEAVAIAAREKLID